MEDLEKTEERRLIAQAKLAQATETADDAKRFVFFCFVEELFERILIEELYIYFFI